MSGSSMGLGQLCSRVFVVGGTHGNEYTGVWVVKALEAQRSSTSRLASLKSLHVETLIGNPLAYAANRRFMDADLNRQFSKDVFLKPVESPSAEKLVASCTSKKPPPTREAERAIELEALMGPKFGPQPAVADVVIDLHSTTANMGVTLIVSEHDPLMVRAAAYVVSCLGSRRGCGADEIRILAHSTSRGSSPGVSSVGKHAFTIEVGPVPQGVVRHDAVQRTESVLFAVLDFLEKFNTDSVPDLPRTVACFRSVVGEAGQNLGKIPWPTDPENPNFPAVCIHASVQDQDWAELNTGDPLFVKLDGSVLPYDGSRGDNIRVVFVNEGGYYYASSGTGIGVVAASILPVVDC